MAAPVVPIYWDDDILAWGEHDLYWLWQRRVDVEARVRSASVVARSRTATVIARVRTATVTVMEQE